MSKDEIQTPMLDLANYLSGLETRVPRRFVTRRFARIAGRMRASVSRRELIGFEHKSTRKN